MHRCHVSSGVIKRSGEATKKRSCKIQSAKFSASYVYSKPSGCNLTNYISLCSSCQYMTMILLWSFHIFLPLSHVGSEMLILLKLFVRSYKYQIHWAGFLFQNSSHSANSKSLQIEIKSWQHIWEKSNVTNTSLAPLPRSKFNCITSDSAFTAISMGEKPKYSWAIL